MRWDFANTEKQLKFLEELWLKIKVALATNEFTSRFINNENSVMKSTTQKGLWMPELVKFNDALKPSVEELMAEQTRLTRMCWAQKAGDTKK